MDSIGPTYGRLKREWSLLALRVRGLERVRLYADLTILAQFGSALANSRGLCQGSGPRCTVYGAAMQRVIGVLLLAATLTGCGKAADPPTLPSGTIAETAKVPKDYDPSKEQATAIDLRDRLTAAGLPCNATPRMVNRYQDNFGNVLSLTCTVDERVIEVDVFRNAEEADAGIGKLSRLACVFNKESTYYVSDDAWVVIVTTGQDGTPTKEGTTPIAEALRRPVQVLECS